jgi:hypothetical protein
VGTYNAGICKVGRGGGGGGFRAAGPWGEGWGCRGRNQATFHPFLSHCVGFRRLSDCCTLRPSDNNSFMSFVTVAAELRTPRGSADQHASCSGLYVNAVSGRGRGRLLRGLLEQMQYLLSSNPDSVSITFHSSPHVCQLAGILVPGMQTSPTSPQEEEEDNSIGLRAKLAEMPRILKPSTHSPALSQLTQIAACMCVCGSSRAQTLYARRARGLSASLEVEGNGRGRSS